MNSRASRLEIALGEKACDAIAELSSPRVLVGGLGTGLTLRATLDRLPPSAQVVVAELNPTIVGWCRGPLAPFTASAVDDRRIEIRIDDVAALIRRAGKRVADQLDAIIIDLYEGPVARTDPSNDPLIAMFQWTMFLAANYESELFHKRRNRPRRFLPLNRASVPPEVTKCIA